MFRYVSNATMLDIIACAAGFFGAEEVAAGRRRGGAEEENEMDGGVLKYFYPRALVLHVHTYCVCHATRIEEHGCYYHHTLTCKTMTGVKRCPNTI